MSLVTVGISEMAVSHHSTETLVTFSLGSCVGVSLFDPMVGVGGMIHCMLPTASPHKSSDQVNPLTYVDTGVVILLQKLFDLGASRKNLICKVAGCGGNLNPNSDLFKIGERNCTMLRKVLWKNNIIIKGEMLGGSDPKTLYLEMETGRMYVKSRNVLTDL